MIRANLLPRPNERVRAFGIEFSSDALRAVIVSIVAIAAIAAGTYAVEWYRATTLFAQVSSDQALLDQHAAERSALRALASRVTAFREIDRVARDAARSGTDAATSIATIGNALPADVWLDRLDRNDRAFDVAGRSRSLSELGTAVVALGKAMPDREALLIGVDGNEQSLLHFSARLESRETP